MQNLTVKFRAALQRVFSRGAPAIPDVDLAERVRALELRVAAWEKSVAGAILSQQRRLDLLFEAEENAVPIVPVTELVS